MLRYSPRLKRNLYLSLIVPIGTLIQLCKVEVLLVTEVTEISEQVDDADGKVVPRISLRQRVMASAAHWARMVLVIG